MGALMAKHEARVRRLKERALYWSARLHVRPRIVRIAEMSTKWGSCSTLGTVTLARDLASQPEPFQDFVVVHELLHLRVRNHGRLFKALMTVHVPRWKQVSAQAPRLRSRNWD
jgi:predicted metal-dependent hydrolase